ncbi:30S ribosomal protein S8 [Buchnera aphidicola]|uniref:Small ribosomal subunit protein uS8 n=1 Tax=Buchnera aphidicola (Sarucallis kahawaluokalani) TaxID=1241878 RepID=A0A4D6YJR3_9GAMM|nr:30S ribosomal protein S8 [Buchnera aphidicola]QCI26120.1 30S ribosomal protein S8 [Buchnera aphidicola (Sarucallis kahawaluokalani)]
MSMQDPIADMLTSIRNSQAANKVEVCIFSSNIKIAIANVLKKEGYIVDYIVKKKKNKSMLNIFLKYFNGKSVIDVIKRISKPSVRVYKKKKNLPVVMDGLGIAILSTSKGVISNKQAIKIGIGGEVICIVS